jgi:hypothetical protein
MFLCFQYSYIAFAFYFNAFQLCRYKHQYCVSFFFLSICWSENTTGNILLPQITSDCKQFVVLLLIKSVQTWSVARAKITYLNSCLIFNNIPIKLFSVRNLAIRVFVELRLEGVNVCRCIVFVLPFLSVWHFFLSVTVSVIRLKAMLLPCMGCNMEGFIRHNSNFHLARLRTLTCCVYRLLCYHPYFHFCKNLCRMKRTEEFDIV